MSEKAISKWPVVGEDSGTLSDFDKFIGKLWGSSARKCDFVDVYVNKAIGVALVVYMETILDLFHWTLSMNTCETSAHNVNRHVERVGSVNSTLFHQLRAGMVWSLTLSDLHFQIGQKARPGTKVNDTKTCLHHLKPEKKSTRKRLKTRRKKKTMRNPMKKAMRHPACPVKAFQDSPIKPFQRSRIPTSLSSWTTQSFQRS